ncbi:MAG: hypothetical protein M3Z41_07430 [Candidatus Eremiobacteraeota bacterium]|nr:hypothetical protein [Candidatus Eremiobacteraeota bacterium]
MNELLIQRIARLETAARRERAVALGLVVLLLATAQSPAPRPSGPVVVRDASGSSTLSYHGLAVADRSNVTRTAAGVNRSGYPSIDLTDSSGHGRESMYLLSDRPVLRFFDPAGKRRAELFLASDTGNGEFVIRDAAEVTRAAVFRGDQGLPELAFYGSDAKVRAYLSTDDSSPYLVMKDRSGTTRVVVGGYSSGKIGMDIRDSAGVALWSKP